MASQEAKQSASGLEFKLHPLVLINVSDHYTRCRANGIDHSEDGSFRVMGCLLGAQVGRTVDVSNSCEMLFKTVNGRPVFDEAFLMKRLDQYKQVYPTLDVVGWYSTGAEVHPSGLETHLRMTELNESPVLLLLDVIPHQNARELPVRLFESESRIVDGKTGVEFVQAEFKVESEEAERIGVTQVAKILPSGKSGGSDQLVSHYQSMHAAVKMLVNRISLLQSLVHRMDAGEIPFDHKVARDTTALLQRLPVMDPPDFHTENSKECSDAMLAIYMAAITKGLSTAHDVVERYNVAYDRSSQRKNRSMMMS